MKETGKAGEDAALAFLKKQGFMVLEKNYRTPVGEIDIIAKDRGTLVFIEVKTRTGITFGRPFEAVDHRKKEKIKKVALWYMKGLRQEVPARFDVLSILCNNGELRIEHIPDAFEV